ncbi:MAG: DUF2202 domain-containing protein, partial [Candidatus Gracilibacteria bacterium]|nr:DUF2202 domain-containing protein [Candidatus Gracilibacteria bacterium]
IFVLGAALVSYTYAGTGYKTINQRNSVNNNGGTCMSNQNNFKNNSSMSGACLTNIATGTLTDEDKKLIQYSYSEEMLARDLYKYFYEKYNNSTFKNISESEQKHLDSVKRLIDAYNIETPKDYGDLKDAYANLKESGDKGLKEAFETGIKIEMLDIKDIINSIEKTDNQSIRQILANIGSASYMHMKSFILGLKNANLTTDIDYSEYLSNSDLDSKGNSLKTKLYDLLESKGISIFSNSKKYSKKSGKGNGKSIKGMGNCSNM